MGPIIWHSATFGMVYDGNDPPIFFDFSCWVCSMNSMRNHVRNGFESPRVATSEKGGNGSPHPYGQVVDPIRATENCTRDGLEWSFSHSELRFPVMSTSIVHPETWNVKSMEKWILTLTSLTNWLDIFWVTCTPQFHAFHRAHCFTGRLWVLMALVLWSLDWRPRRGSEMVGALWQVLWWFYVQ